MERRIKCEDSWDLGKACGLSLGVAKYIEQYFDYIKSVYIDNVIKISDLDLIENLHDTIYSQDRSRHGLELIMNSIQHAHHEQRIRKEKKISNPQEVVE